MVSGCDQCVWTIGVVAGSLGRTLNDVINGQYVFN